VRFRWCLLGGALIAGGGCGGGDDASAPATTAAGVGATIAASVADGVLPTGFETVSVTVVGPDGTERGLCLYLADQPELRARGLMGVTDLGGRDGMLFRYDAPHDGRFWMKDTVLPLSIAFYVEDGGFVSATDMDPCPSGTECPRYAAAGPFTAAVEVPQGDLPDLGLVEGSTLAIGAAPCG
jgi:uncharacterized membrane protein (UPF0127 family)